VSPAVSTVSVDTANVRPSPLDQLFIYGTLLPGEPRWGHLEPFATTAVPDMVRGALFDTGLGYPAARFDGTGTIEPRIHGRRVTIDRDVLEDCLEMLDKIEGAEAGFYSRLVVDTEADVSAWSYQYGYGLDTLTPIPSGSWLHHTGATGHDSPPPQPRPPVSSTAPSSPTNEPATTVTGTGLLNFVEARVIGSLIEKSLATPQSYPLSLSSLVAACNQRSSRDPVTDLNEAEIDQMLTTAKERRLLRFVHPRSGHGVTKYRHVFDELLGLDPGQTALLGVLLLRGPQTARELRDRTERLHSFENTEAVETSLRDLAALGHVVRLDRQAGQRDERWSHLLS